KFFCRNTASVVHPVICACRLRSLRHQGESSPPGPPCVSAAFVDTANARHSAIDAQDVHDGQTRFVIP
ncbi:MAG TPA: hypothetical protein VFJ16_00940, partial [Longimicrobium sp.]|nr:hypothetical protein [Longimicrobium sp.]